MDKKRKAVFVASPYTGNISKNTINARKYCRFVIEKGHTPFAPHLFYTQLLLDTIPVERELGISMGMDILVRCDEVWVFGHPTIGMIEEIGMAEKNAIPVRWFDEECGELK